MRTEREPDSRDHHGGQLAGLLGEIEQLETIFATWDQAARDAVNAYRGALDALHRTALRRLIRILRGEPQALAALKHAAEDDIVHAVLRYHELVRPSLNERLEGALQSVRPVLASHGGDVDLVTIDPPRIEVRFTGTCDGCAASTLTFHAGVKKAVQQACPEITEVIQVRDGPRVRTTGLASPFASQTTSPWRTVCTLSDIPDQSIHALDLDGVPVLLFRRGALVTCFLDACGHLGYQLHNGNVDAGVITCPHHGFRYDLTNGECLTVAQTQLERRSVRVTAGLVEVRITA